MVYNMAKLFRLRLFGCSETRWMGRITLPARKFGGPHMADYKGNTCPVCKQKFKEADDIVVCPDCGTPYHRECWKKVGVCVHQADHAAGFEWTPDNVISDRPDDIVCPNCGEKLEFDMSSLEEDSDDDQE